MFDPDTVAFRFLGITIWHHDPCKDGTDDSCGWSRPKLTEEEIKYVNSLIDNDFDNVRNFFGEQQVKMVGDKAFFENVSRDDMKRYIRILFRNYKREFCRKWWQHPRCHFWHWRIQITWGRFNICLWNRKNDLSLMESIDW